MQAGAAFLFLVADPSSEAFLSAVVPSVCLFVCDNIFLLCALFLVFCHQTKMQVLDVTFALRYSLVNNIDNSVSLSAICGTRVR